MLRVLAALGLGFSAVPGCSPQPAASLPDGITVNDLPIVMADPIAGTYDQAVDHRSSAGTFKQRYWYSTQFVSGPRAPVIFYFCGEAPCSAKYVQSMADEAKSLGAAVIGLEHRYYGESVPLGTPLTLATMKYLTIDNALEDAAAFIAWAKGNLLLPSGKWLAAGGSYPGMLAAYFREKHPELVAGAWASSAPVNVQLSFAGYDMTVSRALGPECALLFRQASTVAEAQYDAGKGDATLRQLLGKDYVPAISKADYMSDVANIAMGAVQYGQTGVFCAALQQQSANPFQGLLEFVAPPIEGGLDSVTGTGSGTGTGTSVSVAAADAPDPSQTLAQFGPRIGLGPDQADGTMSPESFAWLYQVCTEVGFYQVHNPQTSDSIMSPLVDDAYYNALCDYFIHQRPAPEKTNATYYQPLAAGQVTNVLFVNGELDPWSVLSFVDSQTLPAGLSSFVVAQGSHCTDLTNLKAGMLVGDFEAHVKVHDLAAQWLAN
jgi:hypothetical protein